MTRRYAIKAKRDRITAAGMITAVCLTLFLLSFSVVVVLNCRWLYDLDIGLMKLEEASGLSVQEIRANYDALIRYNMLWFRGPLVFPTLPMSGEAAIHFQEVKRIFDLIQILCIGSAAAAAALLIGQRKRRSRIPFTIAGILTLVLPGAAGLLIALDWERVFITFHRLVFQNDYWLFDPVTDPVITILPDAYFLQCAAGIVILTAAGAVLFLLIGRRRPGHVARRSYENHRRRTRN